MISSQQTRTKGHCLNIRVKWYALVQVKLYSRLYGTSFFESEWFEINFRCFAVISPWPFWQRDYFQISAFFIFQFFRAVTSSNFVNQESDRFCVPLDFHKQWFSRRFHRFPLIIWIILFSCWMLFEFFQKRRKTL